MIKNRTSVCTGRESVHCLQPGEGHKGQWHITKEMINGFGICINFLVKSHEDFCWLLLPCVHKSKTHMLCWFNPQLQCFYVSVFAHSEASLLPLFSCRSNNLLPFLQEKLFLKNNSVYPEMVPSLYTWWAESSKFCEGFRLSKRVLGREHCSA